MADIMFNSAQGAVDSLLGSLAAVLANEARLVSSVHSEVQFIKDEMESMNGFLLHVAEEEDGGKPADHQVRAWKKQVKEVAYASQECVDLYVTGVLAGRRRNGPLSYVLGIPHMVRTLPTRRRITARIRELKVRAQEVGERRLRYGVEIRQTAAAAAAAATDTTTQDGGASNGNKEAAANGGGITPDSQLEDKASSLLKAKEDELRRSQLMMGGATLGLEIPGEAADAGFHTLVERLVNLLTDEGRNMEQTHRFIPIVGPLELGGRDLAVGAYDDPRVTSLFQCQAWCRVGYGSFNRGRIAGLLYDGLRLQGKVFTGNPVADLFYYLQGKRSLVVIEGVTNPWLWAEILDILSSSGSTVGSAIILVTSDYSLALNPRPPYRIVRPNTAVPSLVNRAANLVPDCNGMMWWTLVDIVAALCPTDLQDGFGIKMLLHWLYAKQPACTQEDLSKLRSELLFDYSDINVRRLVVCCYDELPSQYKGCLMYLTAFQHTSSDIRRGALTRRWVSEGLLGKRDGVSPLQEADRCLDELCNRGFITAADFKDDRKVKSYAIPHLILDFLLCVAGGTSESDAKMNWITDQYSCAKVVPSNWDHHPLIARHIKNGSHEDDEPNGCCENSFWNICYKPTSADELVQELLASPRVILVKVLDLEGCRGLRKHHVRDICNKILLLKYLSLRNTNLKELPRDIEKLQYLEVLDIRQTKVRVFTSKVIKLRMLQQLLAGCCNNVSSDSSNGKFYTMILPNGIGQMRNLQVLSHVQVPKNDEFIAQISNLIRLRKLGIILHGNMTDFKRLLRVITELTNCLQSLSIRIEEQYDLVKFDTNEVDAQFKPPKALQHLKIKGLKNDLPNWIKSLDQLTKVTLQETQLTEHAFRILGMLISLDTLRLYGNSCHQNKIAFEKEEFKKLKLLIIDCPHITEMSISLDAAPTLEKIVWSFTEVKSISGVEHLCSLKEFQFNGSKSNISNDAMEAIEQFLVLKDPRSNVLIYHPKLQDEPLRK